MGRYKHRPVVFMMFICGTSHTLHSYDNRIRRNFHLAFCPYLYMLVNSNLQTLYHANILLSMLYGAIFGNLYICTIC